MCILLARIRAHPSAFYPRAFARILLARIVLARILLACILSRARRARILPACLVMPCPCAHYTRAHVRVFYLRARAFKRISRARICAHLRAFYLIVFAYIFELCKCSAFPRIVLALHTFKRISIARICANSTGSNQRMHQCTALLCQ